MTVISLADLASLPENLPVPQDDGGCAHLQGMWLPDMVLPATSGEAINPSRLHGTTVIYCYPMTGRPGMSLPEGWDAIPGARGCTPQTCAFRDHHAELQQLGGSVFGLSTQDTDYQREAAERLHLPFALLSDADHAFTGALRLPTFEVDGRRMIKRVTLVGREARIVKVFYPVLPSDRYAAEVMVWLKAHA